jgi:hypothetical protein
LYIATASCLESRILYTSTWNCCLPTATLLAPGFDIESLPVKHNSISHKGARWTQINAPIAPPAITPAKPGITEELETDSVDDPVTVPLRHDDPIYNWNGCFKSFSGFNTLALL